MLLLLLLLVAAPSAFQGGAAGANAAGGAGLEARVDAVERKFEAELQPAEDRIRSELRNELTGMKGELKRLGGRLDRCKSATCVLMVRHGATPRCACSVEATPGVTEPLHYMPAIAVA